MAEWWWLGEGGGLFIKLLIAESNLSEKDEMGKEGTENIGSEKPPHHVQGEGQNGDEEIRNAGSDIERCFPWLVV